MRRDYLVAYDICEPGRLRKVFQIMRGFGDHLQYSVFRCALTDREKVQLLAKLSEAIHHGEDQVMLVDLGGVSPRSRRRFRTLGLPLTNTERSVLVF
ncbi:MAG: CRISPR-associated endonuclease Cas2 [Candidatus Xenobium sp.]|jgi:CRISPR-associated protein Cas2|nr:CRISPR-associated endonuclease Cas2 [Burkholderiales bacterium]